MWPAFGVGVCVALSGLRCRAGGLVKGFIVARHGAALHAFGGVFALRLVLVLVHPLLWQAIFRWAAARALWSCRVRPTY